MRSRSTSLGQEGAAVPYQAHKRNPLALLRRQMESMPGAESEEAAHVRLWMQDIEAQVGDDPRQQAVTRSAIVAYLLLQRLEAAMLKRSPASEKYADMAIEATRIAERVAKLLRLAGLRSKATGRKDKGEKADFSPPPRERKRSELEAEMMVPPEGESA
jgi:hypothetical protein